MNPKEQAEAEKYAPMGEKALPKPDWEEIEAESYEEDLRYKWRTYQI